MSAELSAAEVECIFCRIIVGEAQAKFVLRNERVVAFHPLNPVTEGHLLVVPVEHVLDFMHKPSVTGETAEAAAALAASWMDGGDTNLITSAGGYATQTVRHLHFHIVPRSRDDGLALPWAASERERALRERVEAVVCTPQADLFRDEAWRHVVQQPFADNRYLRLLDAVRAALSPEAAS